MPGERVTAQAGAEAAGVQQEGALHHMASVVVHFAAEAAGVLLTPYSHGAVDSVAHAQAADRRQGDKVNPYRIDVAPWVNTAHRT